MTGVRPRGLTPSATGDNRSIALPNSSSHDVLIVGAGAAGLATSIFTRRLTPAPEVVLLDGARRPGAKILVSGGGRCNVTNVRVSERDFWGGSRASIRQVLKALPVESTVSFFRDIGVPLHEEADGKLFPDTNRARDVLDALLRESGRVGVVRLDDHRVEAVEREAGGFVVGTGRGVLRARRVVLATGGLSLPKSGSDGAGWSFARLLGHRIVRPVPALVPLILADDGSSPHVRLSGISHDAELTVWCDRRAGTRVAGSLLWTHFGVSGPAALDVSRHWTRAVDEGRDVRITLSFRPGDTFERADGWLVEMFMQRPRATVSSLLPLPSAVAAAVVAASGLAPAQTAGATAREARRRLAHALVEWPLPIVGTRGYNYAEVTAGGVDLAQVNPRTMESRVCPGLFLVGEVLDVDGRLGGFNFQWAWASAMAAARALAGLEAGVGSDPGV